MRVPPRAGPRRVLWTAMIAFNPLAGIFTLYRVGFFPDQWDTLSVAVGAGMSILFLALGILVFRRLERPVLKEL